MRLSRVMAIARRDLRIELGGRRGWLLPLVATIILAPLASAPSIEDTPLGRATLWVDGDVPEEVLALERIERVPPGEHAFLRFERAADGLILHGDLVPVEVREVLEADNGGARTTIHRLTILQLPHRSLFLALVAASILTGAISQSLPGERTSRTLDALLTAAITRGELVTGKWLAWGGFGGLAALAAIAVSLALGRQSPGWWIVPAPTVSMGTVALGFALVRRANDVVGGATVAIRVLPAALTGLGLVAFGLGTIDPLYGALLPLGGALVAAGDTWPGALPPLLATASTLGASAALLTLTARDLVEGERASDDARVVAALGAAGTAAAAWWFGVCGAMIWAAGGNPDLVDRLSRAHGVIAGVLGIALLVGVRMGRALRPLEVVGLTRATPSAWPVAALLGVCLALATPLEALWPLPSGPLAVEARERLGDAFSPAWAGAWVLVLAVVAQETLLRGWLRRLLGDPAQLAVTVLVFTPLDPLTGLVVGGAATGLVRLAGGSVLPAVAARLVAAAPLPLAPLAPVTALWVGAVALGLAALAARAAPADP